MADTFVLIQKDNSGNELEVWLFSTLANAQAQASKLVGNGNSTVILSTSVPSDTAPPTGRKKGD